MKEYTETEALEEIFLKNEQALTGSMLVYKHRFKKGHLGEKFISKILKQYKFTRVQEPLFCKGKHERFFEIDVDAKTYNRVVRVATRKDGGTSDIIITKEHIKLLIQPNKFIRVRCGEYYADFKEDTFIIKKDSIKICFGEIIDHNKAVIFTKED
jgi:hypothetical protein